MGELEFVTYEQFGAKGDGETDDQHAIVAAHAYANEHHLPVKATVDAHYYIGAGDEIAVVKTDTDWGSARFTIDDRAVKNNRAPLFRLESYLEPLDLKIDTLTRGQKNIGFAPGVDCYVVVTQDNIRRYIRRGANQNNGSCQTDNFELKADGTIAHELCWDFDHIDHVSAYPIDKETLHVRGGFFTTIANQEPSTYNYYSRNIVLARSNIEISDIHHDVTGEGETGAPYSGFITISRCARVVVRDCFLTGRKIYPTIGSAGVKVNMGSYDISIGSACDVLFKDCIQKNILDTSRWGIVGSNFCKYVTFDGCIFSRTDAHQGMYNYTIRNCTLGHQGVNVIGFGKITIENSILYGGAMLAFRGDYGSTWSGDLSVKNVIWHPACGRSVVPCIFSADNDGQHDFGYNCSLPTNMTVENLTIDDSAAPEDYENFWIFNNYNRALTPETKETFTEKFHYEPCHKLTLKNIKTVRGKPWKLCVNPLLTPALEVVEE